jgi:photosystem II stability/assembly factor-like uncharacterized protein
MKFILISLLVLFASCGSIHSSESPSTNSSPLALEMLNPPFENHLRGMHVLSDNLVWFSGTNGTWLKTKDAGKTWIGDTLEYAVDFRDIHAFNDQEAVMVSSEDNHVFLVKTIDAGNTWNIVHEDSTMGTFFNGITFFNDSVGFAYGDPIDHKINVLKTMDRGNTWRAIDTSLFPNSLEGEAGFAASGSGLIIRDSTIYIAQGSADPSRILKSTDLGSSWEFINTPMISGEGKGIYGMDFLSKNTGYVIGGGWEQENDTLKNACYTSDGGETWTLANTMATGYRSSVSYYNTDTLFCTGRNGIDISIDGGLNWKLLSDSSLYTVQTSDNAIWFSGKKGLIGKITLD